MKSWCSTTYVVLNDGDTFSPLHGCKIVVLDESKLTADQLSDLENGCMASLLASDAPVTSINILDAMQAALKALSHIELSIKPDDDGNRTVTPADMKIVREAGNLLWEAAGM